MGKMDDPVVTRTVWAQREAAGKTPRICGELSVAEGIAAAPRPRPSIILSHGFGSAHRSLAPHAHALAEAGSVALSIDFCGGGDGSLSDGAWEDMTIETEKADLMAEVRLLLEEPPLRSLEALPARGFAGWGRLIHGGRGGARALLRPHPLLSCLRPAR